MICHRCLRASLRQRQPGIPSAAPTTFRTLSTSAALNLATPVTAETTTTSTPRSTTGAPAATATPGVTQPFSTPLQASPPTAPNPAKPPKPTARPQSSCAPGTVLKGLNFLKNQSDPVAKKDSDYPSWLWSVLTPHSSNSSGGGGGGAAEAPDSADLFSKSKKQRRAAAKALRKLAASNPEALVPRVPVFEQSVDLSLGSAQGVAGRREARGVREELTRAMRGERRRRIKEGNFLKAMA